MPKVKVGDINIHYEVYGRGDPLVMLPGLISDCSSCFFRQVPGLAKNYHVIAVDPRGSGVSDKPDIPCSMHMLAEDAAGVLNALNIRKAHIYGISMGGGIAQHFALRYPGMTASLVLACTSCGGRHSVLPDQEVLIALLDTQQTPKERGKRLLPFSYSQDFIRSSPDVIEHAGSLQLKDYPPPHVFMRRGEAAMLHDTFDRLPEIKVPTLVIAGTADRMMPPENSRILATRIPGAESVTLEGVGHTVSVEAPEAVNKAIHDFLKRHPIAA